MSIDWTVTLHSTKKFLDSTNLAQPDRDPKPNVPFFMVGLQWLALCHVLGLCRFGKR